jgi:protein-S-isoprenylcysteine O-methyltransferase Ste14
MKSKNTLSRTVILAYGLAAYASFHAVFLYLILFLADGPVPHTVETGASHQLGVAIAIDAALVALFGLQHTVMARPAFKLWWTRIIPASMERSTFVVATVACLAVIMTGWAPINGLMWDVQTPVLRMALWGLQGLGWGTVVWSTFLLDHWELFGVRQVIAHFQGRELPETPFRTPSLYRFVRHPMMAGMLLALWAAPEMSWSRVVFAAAFTTYVMFGIRIEERDLVVSLGEDYRRYQERVPRLLPRLSQD